VLTRFSRGCGRVSGGAGSVWGVSRGRASGGGGGGAEAVDVPSDVVSLSLLVREVVPPWWWLLMRGVQAVDVHLSVAE
jgi:hypothetical protein